MEAQNRPAVKALAKRAHAQTHIDTPKGKGGGGKTGCFRSTIISTFDFNTHPYRNKDRNSHLKPKQRCYLSDGDYKHAGRWIKALILKVDRMSYHSVLCQKHQQ